MYIIELKEDTVQTVDTVLQITKQAVQTVQADTTSSSDLIQAVIVQEITVNPVVGMYK